MSEWSQTVYVSVAQRYWNPAWDPGRNREVYGDLASTEGVGANLRVRLLRESATEPDWAPIVARLKAASDHVCFFTDVAEFRSKPSTLENVALHLAREFGPLEVYEHDTFGCRVRGDELTLLESVYNLECATTATVDTDSGLARGRAELGQAVRAIAPDFADDRGEAAGPWAERLFEALAARIPGLVTLSIDLGSQRRIRVTTQA